MTQSELPSGDGRRNIKRCSRYKPSFGFAEQKNEIQLHTSRFEIVIAIIRAGLDIYCIAINLRRDVKFMTQLHPIRIKLRLLRNIVH